ncbi:MAG: stage III sporulation protein AF [Clostridia bacterium]|nr:stage III sporulation protein AF [Clostridia bacterium]
MITVKGIVLSLVFCVFTISLCELLIPKNSYKNQMRLITGAVLIITMLSPFIGGIRLDDFEFNNQLNDISGVTEKTLAYGYKTEIFEILKDNDIDNAKITISIKTDENNSINVSNVIILFDKKDKDKIGKIKQATKERLKLNVETRIGE